jgi:hypothetical protein
MLFNCRLDGEAYVLLFLPFKIIGFQHAKAIE